MTDIASLSPAGCPKGIQPHEWRAALAQRIEALAGQMSVLIEALDQMDGDPDLEPYLAGFDDSDDDREADLDSDVPGVAEGDCDPDTERDGDDEPSLGWTHHLNQTAASFHARSDAGFDLEDDGLLYEEGRQ